MKTALRWSAAILGAALFVAPADAQFFGLRRSYYGPYADPYFAPFTYRPTLRAAPWGRAYSAPIIPIRTRTDDVTLRAPAPTPTAVRASDIRVSSDFAGANNEPIAAAIAANKQAVDPQTAFPEGAIAARIGMPLRLAVGIDPKVAPGKEDLSDVLPKDRVVWNYPPKTEFDVLHEDSGKALLILVPKSAGTFRVTAILVEP